MAKWISIQDRLPNEDDLVVVARFYEHGTRPDATVCWFWNGEFHVWTDGIVSRGYYDSGVIQLDMDITHWMPLGAPDSEA